MNFIKTSLLFIVFTSLISCSEYYSKDLEIHNLKGKVTSLKSTKFKALEKFGKIVKGKKRSRNEKDDIDIQHSNISLLFDTNGNIEWLTYFDKYDNIESKIMSKDTVLNCYSSEGNLIEKHVGNDSYHPTELNSYDSDGKLTSKVILKYDDKKHLVEEKEYTASGNLIRVSGYEYNNNNYVSKEDRLEIRKRKGYFSKKRDTIKLLRTYSYNNKNDVIEFTVLKNNEKKIKTYTYKYDENENWIQKIEYDGSTPKYLIEREISYLN